MNSKGSLTVVMLLTAVLLVGGIYFVRESNHTVELMDTIADRTKSPGEYMDYDGLIGVETVDDLGWWKDGSNWHIAYGNLELVFTPTNLQDEDFLRQVGAIGLDVWGDLEGGDLTFYWYGEELAELVPY